MKKLALIMMATASLVATVGTASAQYYYGGRYYNPNPYYGGRRYYDDGYYPRRGYGYRGYADGGPIYGSDSRGRPEIWYRVGPRGSCPRGYTVQEDWRLGGVCKLYRGYGRALSFGRVCRRKLARQIYLRARYFASGT
jgi:hypothetical protein